MAKASSACGGWWLVLLPTETEIRCQGGQPPAVRALPRQDSLCRLRVWTPSYMWKMFRGREQILQCLPQTFIQDYQNISMIAKQITLSLLLIFPPTFMISWRVVVACPPNPILPIVSAAGLSLLLQVAHFCAAAQLWCVVHEPMSFLFLWCPNTVRSCRQRNSTDSPIRRSDCTNCPTRKCDCWPTHPPRICSWWPIQLASAESHEDCTLPPRTLYSLALWATLLCTCASAPLVSQS